MELDDQLTRLEAAYLAAPDPRGSGFRGDERRWEQARRVIMEAVDRDGDFLDVGCANGLLLQSVVTWAAEHGHRLEPHGVEVSARLAAKARSLTGWPDRIHVGDVMTWPAPQRYDFVRTELVYVPEDQHPALVYRCLDDLVAPGGRLIVCGYRSSGEAHAADVGLRLSGLGFQVAGAAQGLDDDGSVMTHVCWIHRC